MRPSSEQFPICKSCDKPIVGEAKEVKTRTALSPQLFHQTPEECASAKPGRKLVGIRPVGTELKNKITGVKDAEPEDKIYD